MKGSCLCGNLKYEVDDLSGLKSICHCLQCRKVTGSTYATCCILPLTSLHVSPSPKSPPKHHTFTQESGLRFTLTFCAECGSAIGKTQAEKTEGVPVEEKLQGVFILFMGTLDGEEVLGSEGRPQVEIWAKHRVEWVKSLEGDGVGQASEFPEM